MVFAFWTETLTNIATADRLDPLQLVRSVGIESDARLFIDGIPEGTSQYDVEGRYGCYVSPSWDREREALKGGFYDEWPLDVRGEFRDSNSSATRISWSEF
jgi:hypothetical protein